MGLFDDKPTDGAVRVQIIDLFNKVKSDYKHFDMLDEINEYIDDPAVGGVLVRVGNPPGTAGAFAELAMEFQRFSEKKPSVAIISDFASVGAYMAACGCSHIVASPMAVVGAVSEDSAARLAASGSSLAFVVPKGAEWFTSFVSRRRGQPKCEDLLKGAVLGADEAKTLHFIDEIGTYLDAKRWLLQKLGKKWEEVDFFADDYEDDDDD